MENRDLEPKLSLNSHIICLLTEKITKITSHASTQGHSSCVESSVPKFGRPNLGTHVRTHREVMNDPQLMYER